jgi:peptidoglycan/xylan/chitin deacetylase (PgdA/CDA1 family)
MNNFGGFLLSPLSKGRLSVFLFHKIPLLPVPLVPEDMELVRFEHMLDDVLSAFHILPLDIAVDLLQKNKLPPRSACITFDDGYPDWLLGAVPALLKRNMHATFFITTGQFSGKPLWHERVQAAIKSVSKPTIDLSHLALKNIRVRTHSQRQSAVRLLDQELKYLTVLRREQLINELEIQCGSNSLSVPVMTIEALRDLHARGFAIGAHTTNHPILTYCSSQEVAIEIGAVREELEYVIKGTIKGFAYPNGRPHADFSSLHVSAVKKAGYKYAVTTHWGAANSITSPFQIPRFTPWSPRTFRALYQIGVNLLSMPLELRESST